MKILKSLILTLMFIVIGSYGGEKILIDYGKDKCNFCSMPVKNEKVGSLAITADGKKLTFCTIECAVGYYIQNKDIIKQLKVPNYLNPSEFLDAKDAVYLQSEKLKTPMGMNISAYKTKEDALKMQKEYGGKIMNWEELQKAIKEEFLPRFQHKMHHH